MVYQDLSSPQVESLDRSALLVLIPIGSIEAHGAHLPIGTDSIIVEHFAKEVEAEFTDKIILAPTIQYAFNSVNFDYPGTLSINQENFAHQLQDIIWSFYHHGFENFLIFSSHGANEVPVKLAIQNILSDGREDYPQIAFKTWWQLAKLRSRHAEKLETELMMEISPDLVDLDKATDCKPENPWHYFPSRRVFHPDTYGVNGEPTKANAKSSEIVYQKVSDSLADYINSVLEKLAMDR